MTETQKKRDSTCWMYVLPLILFFIHFVNWTCCKCSFPDHHKSHFVMRGSQPSFSFSPFLSSSSSPSFSTASLSGRNSVAMVISIASYCYSMMMRTCWRRGRRVIFTFPNIHSVPASVYASFCQSALIYDVSDRI